MEDTIFAKIIRREVPAEIVYEDEDTLAFLDVKPINLGHALVVPKKFARNLLDVRDESLTAVIRTAQKVALALREVGAEGVNIGINNEPAAGQVVFHFHVHVIPRYASDGLEHWNSKEVSQDESSEMAAQLREKLM